MKHLQIQHCDWTEEDAFIEPQARVPTLLHPGEIRLLHWLGRSYYRGWGAVVDGGSFVGGSTAALGWGLKQNLASAPGCLHAFDLFEMEPSWPSHPILKTILDGASNGEELFALWQRNTSGLDDLITLHKGDITQDSWADGDIEICFMDVLKNWDILNWTHRHFYPCLKAGSVLVHQDFYHRSSYFTPLSMAHLGTCFERIANLEWSNVVFVCRNPIPRELLQINLRRAYSLEQALVMHRSWGAGRNRLELGMLESQAVLLAIDWGDLDRAKSIAQLALKDYGDILRVKSTLEQMMIQP